LPNGKSYYEKDLGNREYSSKSGSWSQNNDSTIELIICGREEDELCNEIPLRIRSPFMLGKITHTSDYEFQVLFIRKSTLDTLGKIIYIYENKSKKHKYEWMQRFANGNIHKIRPYKKGKLHGEQLEYEINGKLISKKIFERGKLKFDNNI